ncbi:hypothetical protein OG612_36885 [Streptomyces sp. NBC_01527]|uniref:hypothetical protein n=1 Tax=Streptomyces sp. NBC_01527 TaxID=2903894 RepID=UPI003862E61E
MASRPSAKRATSIARANRAADTAVAHQLLGDQVTGLRAAGTREQDRRPVEGLAGFLRGSAVDVHNVEQHTDVAVLDVHE